MKASHMTPRQKTLCVKANLFQSLCWFLFAAGESFHPKLFILELLRAYDDGPVVLSGLQADGNQQHAHNLFL